MKYVAPQTKNSEVELEQGFMAGSTNFENPNDENGKIQEHEVNTDFKYDFNDQGWDPK